MTYPASAHSRRAVLGASGAAFGVSVAGFASASATAADGDAIRPFRADIPQAALDDLRRRIAMTRWPEHETVADRSQGAQPEPLQRLVRYWGTEYDWRRGEVELNRYPQFVTEIDGVDIHFIHVRSRHRRVMPMIMTHGWPGSLR